MSEATLIFPHQLFQQHPGLRQTRRVYLIEEYLFFRQYNFHKQKLAFHRATMKHYEAFLLDQGIDVKYINSTQPESDIRHLNIPEKVVHIVDPTDDYLLSRLENRCALQDYTLKVHESPLFINKTRDLHDFFTPKKKKYFQTEFYKIQRKKLGILIAKNGKPEGEKWTFDSENRRKFPRNQIPPHIQYPDSDPIYREACKYVDKIFSDNPGMLTDSPLYPYNFETAQEWLDQFLNERLLGFGDYEDAMTVTHSVLHHSVLSPLINVGLLRPKKVIDQILAHAEINQVPINNTEGIVRQIIGWREFIRGVYEVKGRKERTTNFWGFSRKIPPSFYQGNTGIEPIDLTIKKLLKTGYNHHIERLMVLGNFMLLCEFDPDEVYRWFMEMYIDAYDWVMVPNVYGMSQFADGGILSTKPYISGSNYLLKMSDFPKGHWQEIWDGLFWRFLHVHRDFFLKNPRLSMLVRTFDRMNSEKQNAHIKNAEDFLRGL